MADSQSSKLGSGGMITKIWAAKICMNSGCSTVITNGHQNYPLRKINKKIQHGFMLLTLQVLLENNGY